MKWGYDQETADCICSLNRYCAEYRGYFAKTNFVKEATSSGTPSFITPRQQIMKEFFDESLAHAWPSFRDEEVVWANVRCLSTGEAVSVNGTHLGHNLHDRKGSRHCINLVSVAGQPG
mmetsp:Transcript_5451/g.8304  ORF Transcript_5451/g.8304 Transcript_5451/m.8304 type:complete len:118 (-) Transcript_5451:3434-3787(-)